MDLVSLLITLASGVAAGNITGSVSKENSLGPLGNSITGAVGGGVGNWIAQALGLIATIGASSTGLEGSGVEGMHFEHLIGSIASGGVGGAILTLIVGYIKNLSNK